MATYSDEFLAGVIAGLTKIELCVPDGIGFTAEGKLYKFYKKDSLLFTVSIKKASTQFSFQRKNIDALKLDNVVKNFEQRYDQFAVDVF